MHILFVCTGNICRSPTAERLALRFSNRIGIPCFEASSAGTHALIDHPIHARAAEVLEGLGGDPSDFSARQLTHRIASNADLILTMTRGHRDRVLEIAPNMLNKTFALGEAAGLASDTSTRSVRDLASLRPRSVWRESLDVPDPMGQDLKVFASVGAQIAQLMTPVIEFCRRAAEPADRSRTGLA